MISEERLEKALRFLAETDEKAAELKVQVHRKSYIVDLSRKREFLKAEASTIETKKAIAETSVQVRDSITEELDAELEWEKLRAKRATEELIVEVFRTLEASRRQGRI
jgi:hypothetical protein